MLVVVLWACRLGDGVLTGLPSEGGEGGGGGGGAEKETSWLASMATLVHPTPLGSHLLRKRFTHPAARLLGQADRTLSHRTGQALVREDPPPHLGHRKEHWTWASAAWQESPSLAMVGRQESGVRPLKSSNEVARLMS